MHEDHGEDVHMDQGDDDVGMERMDLNLSSASTTIDPRSAASRILTSPSLAAAATEPDDDGSPEQQQPHFTKLSALQANGNRAEYRRVRCPPHRYTPLREHWEQILTPLVEYLKLQVRYEWKLWGLGGALVRGMQLHPTYQERCVVPGNSNPPGSLDVSRRCGAIYDRCLTYILSLALFIIA
jgi:hypothetical protein